MTVKQINYGSSWSLFYALREQKDISVFFDLGTAKPTSKNILGISPLDEDMSVDYKGLVVLNYEVFKF